MSKIALPPWFKVENAAGSSAPAKIHIRGIVGQKWDLKNLTATNTEELVLNELDKIDKGKPIHAFINSKGGEVGYALGIYNAFKRRSADITTHNTGYALSSGSILMLGGGRIISPDSSIWMIHRASAGTYGNAEDKRKDADMLEAHDKTIAGIYAAKTGKSEKDMLDMMSGEKWMTGKEARDLGFADEDGEADPDEPDQDVDNEEERKIICTFRNIPENLRGRLVTNLASSGGKQTQGGAATPPKQTTHMREQIIKALAAEGITLPTDATEEQVLAAWNKHQAGLKDEVTKAKDAQKKRVEARVKKAVTEKRIKAERETAWIARGMADESCLDELDEIPAPKAEQDNPEKSERPQRGAPAAENVETGEEGETDSQIEGLQEEIFTNSGRAKSKEQLEKASVKNGILARKLGKLRGDTKQEIKWEKATAV